MTKYIAYGSNLDINQMQERCPSYKFIKTYNLEGYRLTFKRIMINYNATIEKFEDYYVPVAIYELNEEDELAMDHSEGSDLPPENIRYNKEYIKIDDEKMIIYIMRDTENYGLPTKEYLQRIYNGYKHYNFDINILKEGINFSKSKQKKQYLQHEKECNEVFGN